MLTSQQRVFRKFWHAVVPMSTLREQQPVPFTLLGEPIVLFLDTEGQPAALKDRCCHRTARLSKGRCDGGVLECGYHGWRYDRSGKVIRIPQYEPSRAIPPDYCTPAYRCVERYGYAWVALEEPISPIPEVAEFGAPGWRSMGNQPAACARKQFRQLPFQLRASRHLWRGGSAAPQPL